MQLIVQEEVRLTQLIDPAGGAWHVEMLSEQLARKAWALFQEIEARGGMLAALQSGAIQAEIAAVAERRRQDLATGDKVLLGANACVNEEEPLPSARKRSVSAGMEAGVDGINVMPLKPLRLAEEAAGADA